MKQAFLILLLSITCVFYINAQDDNFAKDEIIIKIKESIPYVYEEDKITLGIPSVDYLNSQYPILSIEKLIKSKPKKEMNKRPNTNKILIIKFSEAIDIEGLVSAYRATEVFDYAEPNYSGQGGGVQGYTPNDADYNKQWQFNNDGTFDSTATVGADIKMEDAWNITTGSSNVVVAILDSGMKLDHPEIVNRLWRNTADNDGDGIDTDNNGFVDDLLGWDFAYGDNMASDGHGHGTNVGSIVGMEGDNGTGLAGVDWNCQLMIGQILDNNNSGWYTWWAAAIYYAVDNGADVINMSVGGSSYSATLEAAIDYAYANDVPVIVCMMNTNNNVSYYPAAYANTIAVGATGVDDNRVAPFFWNGASGSNYGNHIDLVAPGSPIHGLSYISNTNFNSYWGGTSQAAPLVTGVVALMKSLAPSLDIETIRDILKNTADDQVGNPNEDIAGWDQYYGSGRLNAGAALSSVLGIISSNDELELSFDLTLFPNPTSDIIRIDTDGKQMDMISIYSIDGQLVRQLNNVNTNEAVNIKDLPTGIYIFEVKIGEEQVNRKVVKK